MADFDSFGYYDDDETEVVRAPNKVVEEDFNEEEEVEVARGDIDTDAAETLASFPADSPPPKKKPAPKKRKSNATRDSLDTEPKKKRTTRKKKNDDDDDDIVTIGRQTRKKREKVDLPTLADGTIDLSRATMRDIIRSHDKYGKPTKAQAEREKTQERRKKKKLGEDIEDDEEANKETSNEGFTGSKPFFQEQEEEIIVSRGNEEPQEEEEEEEEEVVQEEEENAPAPGVFAPKIVLNANGDFVLDESSMVVHQDIEETRYDPEVVFESTGYINANSFSKRQKTERWSKEETAKFYRVIQQYGSDFTLISKLFPNRNRTQIRNKFKKEEKENPQKIDHALRNRIAPDFDEIRSAVKVAVEKEAKERKEKGIVDEIDEPLPEAEIRPITEEEDRPAEEPSVVYENEEVVAEEPTVVVEEPAVVEEPEELVVTKKPELPAFDYFGNYDEDEEIVGTLE